MRRRRLWVVIALLTGSAGTVAAEPLSITPWKELGKLTPAQLSGCQIKLTYTGGGNFPEPTVLIHAHWDPDLEAFYPFEHDSLLYFNDHWFESPISVQVEETDLLTALQRLAAMEQLREGGANHGPWILAVSSGDRPAGRYDDVRVFEVILDDSLMREVCETLLRTFASNRVAGNTLAFRLEGSCLFTEPAPADRTSDVSVEFTEFTADPVTGIHTAFAAVTNTSKRAIDGPLRLVLPLWRGSLAYPTGTPGRLGIDWGHEYLWLSGDSIAPGESIQIQVDVVPDEGVKAVHMEWQDDDHMFGPRLYAGPAHPLWDEVDLKRSRARGR